MRQENFIKIHQQSARFICQSQIGSELFHKNILKRFDRFNFKCNYILDEQVHTKPLVLNTSSSKNNWKIDF